VTAAEFSPATRGWVAGTDLARRRARGQYMTPRALRERLLDRLELSPGMRVLDPGVGTGEFLRSVLDREPAARVTGWDVHAAVLRVADGLVPEAELVRRSALTAYRGEPFDLVIGNPPYFQLPLTGPQRRRFTGVVSGRANIFALFFQAGLDVLRDGGRLAYVVPPSMNNGAYFEALREHLVARSDVVSLDIVDRADLFADAQTAVQLVVLEKGPSTGRHVFRREHDGFARVVLAQHPERLAAEFAGRRTLTELGYEAVTGTVIWNEHRGALRDGPEDGAVRLVWSSSIGLGGKLLDDPRRKPYVVTGRSLTGPAVVVNRVVGAVGAARLRCALVPEGEQFVGENHVNVVRRRAGTGPAVGWDELVAALSKPEVAGRVRLLTGNTQVSATELTHLLPLDA
jgi:adenine-specific DNA-methyltransferase